MLKSRPVRGRHLSDVVRSVSGRCTSSILASKRSSRLKCIHWKSTFIPSFHIVPSRSPSNETPFTMSSTASSQTQTSSDHTISVVSTGIHRLPMINAAFVEHQTPYRVVAFLDFDQTPPANQYSAHNLAVLLYNLHPRPKAVLTGTAVLCMEGQEGIVEEVREVLEEYMMDVLEKEGKEGVGDQRGVYVPVSCVRW